MNKETEVKKNRQLAKAVEHLKKMVEDGYTGDIVINVYNGKVDKVYNKSLMFK